MNSKTAEDRRGFVKSMAGLGVLGAARAPAHTAAQNAPPARSRMKITGAEPIMTGRDVFLKIETDAGITGYGDATNHFLPYTTEGALRDLIPCLNPAGARRALSQQMGVPRDRRQQLCQLPPARCVPLRRHQRDEESRGLR